MRKFISTLLFIFLYTGISFADDRLALMYNILPDDSKNSVIDKKSQNKLTFRLYENQGNIYYNNQLLKVTDNCFEINIADLTGKQTFTFTNDYNEEMSITYYLSNENGLVKGYELNGVKNLDIYTTTIGDTKIIYTSKDAKKIDMVTSLIKSMPEKTKANLKEITLLPTKHSSNAAGITNYDKITFYDLSSYSDKTIKQIVFHEIAHTWAYELIKDKQLDYSYMDYQKAVKNDKNFVSNYSKAYIDKNNNYSEDFADSVAFYLMDSNSFEKKYPNRADYITNLLAQ